MKQLFSRTLGPLAMVLTLSGGFWIGAASMANAQVILEEQGTIDPALQEYSFELEADDVVAITLTSEDFDTVLSLLGPDGQEVAFNDDFGGTLNSRIIYAAETAGNYTVLAKSFDGQGGAFDLQVRPATEYEVAYNQAIASAASRDFEGAIAAYTEAIELDDSNPEAYLGRADAYFGQAQAQLEAQGMALEEPSDLEPDVREAIVADFREAADLYEAAGDPFTAESLREQIQYIETGEFPGPSGGGERSPEAQ